MKRYLLMVLSVLIGAFLMQGFQCASPEFTTAKLALKNKEYTKAEGYFEKEVKKNPQNAEAWMYLAETRLYLRKYIESNEAAKKAIEYAGKNLKIQLQAQNLRSKLWRDVYSRLIINLNKYAKTKNDTIGQLAIQNADVGLKLAPYIFDFYNLRGYIYQLMGNKKSSIADYQKYYNEILPSINFAKEHNLFIDIPLDKVIKNLGKPSLMSGTKQQNGDSLVFAVFNVDKKDLYVKAVSDGNIFKVKTWRYNPPAEMLEADKLLVFDLSSDPIVELIQYYYNKKEYPKALQYLKGLLILKPNDEQINNFMVTLYTDMGKKDEATKRLEKLIKADPNNKSFRLSYGNLLMQMKRYDDAIVQYKKSLQIDPNYYDAMRNLASAYKNKAYVIQKRQIDEAKGDATKMKPDEYLPFLKLSGANFEKCRKTPKYANDINVLFDLVDIYFVTKNQDKLKRIVAELEAIETLVPKEQLENYYLGMVKIFDQRLPNEVKFEKYQKKAQSLK